MRSRSNHPPLWVCIATRVQRGPLFQRECLVGHLSPWVWRRIKGRKSKPTTAKFARVRTTGDFPVVEAI